MMAVRRIVNSMTAEPFRPFRISMASGKTYEIRHPEMISVGRTTARVYLSMSEDEEEARQGEQEISVLLIESVELLDSTVKQGR